MHLILEPYFTKNSETGSEVVKFKLESTEMMLEMKSKMFCEGFEHYLHELYYCMFSLTGESLPLEFDSDDFKRMSPIERGEVEKRFTQFKKSLDKQHQCHPDRLSRYDLRVNIIKKSSSLLSPGTDDSALDWPMIRLARDLSNVNTVFRQELGEILWKAVEVEFDCEEESIWNGWEPMAFLLERPMIIKGLKSLTIPFDEEYAGQFKTFCRYAANVVDLQHLTVDMRSIDYNENTRDLVGGRGAFAGIEVVRQIKVSESLKVRLWRRSGHNDKYEEAYDGLLKLLMPNTLRGGKAITTGDDKQKEYLSQRLLESGV